MLREISSVNQNSASRIKRWFTSSNMDIFIWHDDNHCIEKFQCSYDKKAIEKAIIWSAKVGFTQLGVDSGERAGKYPLSPVYTEIIDIDPLALCTLLDQEVEQDAPRELYEVVMLIKQHLIC